MFTDREREIQLRRRQMDLLRGNVDKWQQREQVLTARVQEDSSRVTDLEKEVAEARDAVNEVKAAFATLVEVETEAMPRKRKERAAAALKDAFTAKHTSFLPPIDGEAGGGDDGGAANASPAGRGGGAGRRHNHTADLKTLVSRETMQELHKLRADMHEARNVYDKKRAQLDLLQRKYQGLMSLSRLAAYGMCRGDTHIGQIKKTLHELETVEADAT